MSAAHNSLLSDRPLGQTPGWPAWTVSLVIHLSLFAVALLLLKPPLPKQAAIESTREVSITLKRLTDDGPIFEEQEEAVADNSNAPSEANNPLLAALPTPAETAAAIPKTDAALPRLPMLGPDALPAEQAASVQQMTTGGSPSKQLGNKATTSVFGISGTGTRFVYVFDRSISMAGPPLRAAKQQLIASLEPLDTVHQFQVIFFNHEPHAWDLTGGQQRIAFATDANKRTAAKFIKNVSATGGTFRHSALQLALRLGPDVVFFLTDIDNPMNADDLNAAIRRAQDNAIAINTIEYGDGPASLSDNFLKQLARQTRGQYVYVDTTQLRR